MRHSQQAPYPSHPSSRRGSDADQSYALQAAAQLDDYSRDPRDARDDSSVASRASRQSYDGDCVDAETRIAQIKAQKEKDRQRENAEKEMQVRQLQ